MHARLVARQRVEQRAPGNDRGLNMSMQELEDCVVDFGEVHRGQSFQAVWEDDQQWVAAVARRYAASTDRRHQLFLYFVEAKVERLELLDEVVPLTCGGSDAVGPRVAGASASERRRGQEGGSEAAGSSEESVAAQLASLKQRVDFLQATINALLTERL